jgi:hypothetical protein
VSSVLRSSQSDANKVATPRTPDIANTAKPLNIRRASLGCFIGAFIGTSAASAGVGPQGK